MQPDQRVAICVTLGPDLLLAVLDQAGVAGWNNWLARGKASCGNSLGQAWGPEEPQPALQLSLDCRGIDLRGRILDGIDLCPVHLADARLQGASLQRARFYAVRRADFTGCDLRGACFDGAEIGGAVFTDALLDEHTSFEYAHFDADQPPVGLQPELVARIARQSFERDSGWRVAGMVEVDCRTTPLAGGVELIV